MRQLLSPASAQPACAVSPANGKDTNSLRMQKTKTKDAGNSRVFPASAEQSPASATRMGGRGRGERRKLAREEKQSISSLRVRRMRPWLGHAPHQQRRTVPPAPPRRGATERG